MHLLYLDDAGSVPNPDERYFVLGGVSVFEAQVNHFISEMDRLAESVWPEKPDAVELAFEDLTSRFDRYLTRLRQDGDRQRGMMLLDQTVHETPLQELARDFRKMGTRWGNIQNIADVPVFVNSKASRLVQVADHVAYATFRRFNAGDAQYFDIIASRFFTADNVVHGLSHKVADHGNCMCPACLSRRLSSG